MGIVQAITAEGGLTFSQLFSEFSTDFGVVTSFFSSHTIFMALIAFPVGVFAIGSVIKAIR
jgi:hypothetical protein